MPTHPAVEAGRAKMLKRIYLWACHCVKCGTRWESSGETPPDYCPGCHMINWWVKRPVGRPPGAKKKKAA